MEKINSKLDDVKNDIYKEFKDSNVQESVKRKFEEIKEIIRVHELKLPYMYESYHNYVESLKHALCSPFNFLKEKHIYIYLKLHHIAEVLNNGWKPKEGIEAWYVMLNEKKISYIHQNFTKSGVYFKTADYAKMALEALKND